MKIKLHFIRTNKIEEIKLSKGTTVEELLKKIEVKPDTVIIIDKNRPITIKDELCEGQNLTVLQVSSGG